MENFKTKPISTMSYQEHDEIMQILLSEFENVKSKRGSQVFYVYHKDICVTIIRLSKNKFHNGSEYCTKENLAELAKKECLLRQENFEYFGEQEDALFERLLSEYIVARNDTMQNIEERENLVAKKFLGNYKKPTPVFYNLNYLPIPSKEELIRYNANSKNGEESYPPFD